MFFHIGIFKRVEGIFPKLFKFLELCEQLLYLKLFSQINIE